MSLSKFTPRALSTPGMIRVFCIRAASTASSSPPPPAKFQLTVPINEQGFFSYSRNWSRDKKYANPIQQGDTPMRFMFRRLKHAYEVWPLVFLMSAWFTMFAFVSYWSFGKIEVWLDRSNPLAPWDWERQRANYDKNNTVLFDLDGRTHKRLEIMEQLQDEMLEAAKKRGTR